MEMNLKQIGDILDLRYSALSLLTSNCSEFKVINEHDLIKYFIIDNTFFENMKKAIERKISSPQTSKRRIPHWKESYLRLIEWQNRELKS